MSRLADIYTALAGVTIMLEGSPVAVRPPEDMPTSVAASMLPLRILAPVTGPGENLGSAEVGLENLAGTSVLVTWAIRDILLLAPVPVGRGQRSVAARVIDYMGAYVDAIPQINTALAPYAGVVRAGMVADVIEYPTGGDMFFYGVVVTLEIEEEID